jgi:hypothetical protein
LDTVEPLNEPRPFYPGRNHKYLPSEVNIDDFRPDTIAFAALAGNYRAVEYIHGDDGIPQWTAKPISSEVECACCGEMKPRRSFPKDNRKRNGLGSYCRECERGRAKVYRLRHASWFEENNDTTNRAVNLSKTG